MEEKVLLEQNIEKGDFDRGGEVSSKLKDTLRRLGIKPDLIRKVSIISYELEMNIIIHSLGGKIKVKVNTEELKIKAEDKGPGIENIEKALEPGYSTAGEEIREMGFGAGMGLNNIERFSDRLNIDSQLGEGTRVEAHVFFE